MTGCSNLLKIIFKSGNDCGCSFGTDLICPDFEPEAVKQVLNLIYKGQSFVDSKEIYVAVKKVLKVLEICIDYQEIKVPQMPAATTPSTNAKSKLGPKCVREMKRLRPNTKDPNVKITSFREDSIATDDPVTTYNARQNNQLDNDVTNDSMPSVQQEYLAIISEDSVDDVTASTDLSISHSKENVSLKESKSKRKNKSMSVRGLRKIRVVSNDVTSDSKLMTGNEEDDFEELRALTNDILTQMEELSNNEENTLKELGLTTINQMSPDPIIEQRKVREPLTITSEVVNDVGPAVTSIGSEASPNESCTATSSVAEKESRQITADVKNNMATLSSFGRVEGLEEMTNNVIPISVLSEEEMSALTNDGKIQLLQTFTISGEVVTLSGSSEEEATVTKPKYLSNQEMTPVLSNKDQIIQGNITINEFSGDQLQNIDGVTPNIEEVTQNTHIVMQDIDDVMQDIDDVMQNIDNITPNIEECRTNTEEGTTNTEEGLTNTEEGTTNTEDAMPIIEELAENIDVATPNTEFEAQYFEEVAQNFEVLGENNEVGTHNFETTTQERDQKNNQEIAVQLVIGNSLDQVPTGNFANNDNEPRNKIKMAKLESQNDQGLDFSNAGNITNINNPGGISVTAKTLKILSYRDLIYPDQVDSESRYVCKICTTSFKTKGNMSMHYTSHFRNEILAMNNNNNDTCIACNEKFITSQSLLYHIGKSHNGFERLFSGEDLTEVMLSTPVERRGRKRLATK